MAVKIKLDLLKKGDDIATRPAQRPQAQEPEEREIQHEETAVIEKPKQQEPDNGFTLGREDDETFHKNEHKFEGSNASILTDAPVKTSFELPVQKAAEPVQEEVVEEVQQIKAFCIGGNENYYRNVLEPLNTSTPDIRFLKHFPSSDNLALMAIDSLQPDIVLIYWKTPTVDTEKFWDMICNSRDENGVSWHDKFSNKRLIVVIPNDIACEIKTRELGLFFTVKETNPQRHEFSIDTLIEQIRTAYSDIKEASAPEQATVEAEPAANEVPAVANEPIIQQQPAMQQPEQQPVIQQPQVQQQPVMQAPPVQNATPQMTRPIPQRKIIPQQPAQQPAVQQQPVIQQQPVQQQPIIQQQPIQQEQQSIQTSVRRKIKEIEREQETPSKIIGVYSVTGGAGTTTCATNLAAILAKSGNNEINNDYRVLLLEYNLSCQCVDIFFNIKTDKNICQLAKSVHSYVDNKGSIRIDSEKMKPFIEKMISHDDVSGLDILLGLSIPLEFDYIRDGFTKCLFATLREMYDVVIVDLSSDMAKSPILDALYALDQIYYIMPMDVASIRNTKQIIPVLKSLFRFTPERIRVILNKVIENNREFDVEQVFQALRQVECEPEGIIPYEETELISALNRGVPIAIENPDHPVSQALYSIAVGINPMMEMTSIGAADEKPKKKGFLGSLFGGGGKKKKPRDGQKTKRQRPERPMQREMHREQPMEDMPDDDMMLEEEEQPKKKGGFFSRFFGGGKKKKKKNEPEARNPRRRKGERPRPEPEEEIPMEPEDIEMEDEAKEEPKKKGGLFASLKNLFGGGKKVKVKKSSHKKKGLGGLLGKNNKSRAVEDDDIDEPAPRQSRLAPHRRKPLSRS